MMLFALLLLAAFGVWLGYRPVAAVAVLLLAFALHPILGAIIAASMLAWHTIPPEIDG